MNGEADVTTTRNGHCSTSNLAKAEDMPCGLLPLRTPTISAERDVTNDHGGREICLKFTLVCCCVILCRRIIIQMRQRKFITGVENLAITEVNGLLGLQVIAVPAKRPNDVCSDVYNPPYCKHLEKHA